MRTSKISSGNSASEDFQFPVIVPSKGQDYPLVLAYWIMKRQTWLFRSVQSESSFQAFGNVYVVGEGHAINQIGSSGLAAILNAAALLLKLSTAYTLERVAMHLYYAVETPTTPDAFEIFGGQFPSRFKGHILEPSLVLNACLLVLQHPHLNPISTDLSCICNSPEFKNTTVNNALRCNTLESCTDDESLYDKMLNSGAAFARPFKEDAAALDVIDENVLSQASKPAGEVLCSEWGDIDDVEAAGSYGIKLGFLLSGIASEEKLMRTSHRNPSMCRDNLFFNRKIKVKSSFMDI
ncbi:hypothetical protein POTOM_037117 [Populus tomentosa]|uniref:Uncharacterized protein n=1 Tax=Populus tomentosa TaxID=118781 RepID=A0A8X8CNS7_POPTO|nr:hypothetical protein POTOM_037117 [Populus tomentosa]